MNKAAEPSMEEILASIRRIVTEDPTLPMPPAVPTATSPTAASATTKPTDAVAALQKRLEIEDFDAVLDLVDSAPARKRVPTGSDHRKQLSVIVSSDVDDMLEPAPAAVGPQSSGTSNSNPPAKDHDAASLADNSQLTLAATMSGYGKSAVVPNALIPMGGAFHGMPRSPASRPTWQYVRPETATAAATVGLTSAAPVPVASRDPDVVDVPFVSMAPTAPETNATVEAMDAEQTAVSPLSAMFNEASAPDIVPLPMREDQRSGLEALTSALASMPFASTLPVPTVSPDVHAATAAIESGGTVDVVPLPLLLPLKVRDFAATAEATLNDQVVVPPSTIDMVAPALIEAVTTADVDADVIAAPIEAETSPAEIVLPELAPVELTLEAPPEQHLDSSSTVIAGVEPVTVGVQPDEQVTAPVDLPAVAHVADLSGDTSHVAIPDPECDPEPQVAFASNLNLNIPAQTATANTPELPVPPPSFAALRTLAQTVLPTEPTAPIPSLAPSWALARGAARSTPGTSAPILAGDSSPAASLAAMEALFPIVRKPSVEPKLEPAKVVSAPAELAAPIVPAPVATAADPLTPDRIEEATSQADVATMPVAADEVTRTDVLNAETPMMSEPSLAASGEALAASEAPDFMGTETANQPDVDVPETAAEVVPAAELNVNLPVEVPLAAVAAAPLATAPVSAATVAIPAVAPAPARSLEDAVVDLLRPMLRNWIDVNMPVMVEKALRAETSAMSTPVLPISVPTSPPAQKPN